MKRILAGVLALVLCLPLTGCAPREKTRQAYLLNTIVRLTLWGADDALFDDCFALIREAEAALSRTVPSSEIARLNARETDTVSPETAALIADALALAEATGGAFDPTIGRVSALWDFTVESPVVPDAAALAAACASVGYAGVRVDGTTVTFADPDTQLDLGAIAKGEIADRVAALLRARDVAHAILNLGGNVVVIGGKPDGEAYRVGVQDPAAESGEPLLSVAVHDGSVVTSGIYNRGFTADGQYYHHILDPRTGYPCDNELASVTILSQSSRQGDGLSTACMLLGSDAGLALIEATAGAEAIFITRDGEVICSSGVEPNYDLQMLGKEGES
ncbi:MAG: FAD:protein FMN transferase [Clostridia bacterium]|nr:FAD:protein FMN transferase [Clostridia bacterium]